MAGLIIAVMLASTTVFAPPPPSRPRGSPFAGMSDQRRCALLRDAAERANRRMPVLGANGLRATGMAVDCARRTHETRFSVPGPYAANAAAVRQATTERSRAAVCDNELSGSLARRGWQFTTRYTFADRRELVIPTTCR